MYFITETYFGNGKEHTHYVRNTFSKDDACLLYSFRDD